MVGNLGDSYDIYKITAANGALSAALDGLPAALNGRVQLRIWSPTFVGLPPDTEMPYTVATTTTAGTYYISVYIDPQFINASTTYLIRVRLR